MTAPERIWIRQPILDGYDIKPAQIALSQMHDDATGYTRTDIHQAALDRIAELEAALQAIERGDDSIDGMQGDIARAVLAKGDG